MFVLVCFDVGKNRTRRQLTKLLFEYGWRIQQSVFEIKLRRSQFTMLQNQINKRLKAGDRVHYYPLCGKDIGLRQADGKGQIHWHPNWYLLS